MRSRALFLLCLSSLTISVAAQDVPDEREEWEVICDTAETDLGSILCVCAQRDTAEMRMHVVYERIMIMLNRRITILRAQTSLDSSAIVHIEEEKRAVQNTQEAWLALKEATLDLTQTLGEYALWHGDQCITGFELTSERISELEEIEADLKEEEP